MNANAIGTEDQGVTRLVAQDFDDAGVGKEAAQGGHVRREVLRRKKVVLLQHIEDKDKITARNLHGVARLAGVPRPEGKLHVDP
jgi:hypothetical protein